jgi:hypothetical protein
MVMVSITIFFFNKNYFFFMKSKEIHNLFGEPLSDEIERFVMKNKTKKKSKETKRNQTAERNQTVSK